jgi:hypothetical protein
LAHSSLRFGLGRFTTEAEVDFVVKHIVRTVQKLRDMRYGRFPYHDPGVHLLSDAVHYGKWFKKVSISIPLTGHNRSIRLTTDA